MVITNVAPMIFSGIQFISYLSLYINLQNHSIFYMIFPCICLRESEWNSQKANRENLHIQRNIYSKYMKQCECEAYLFLLPVVSVDPAWWSYHVYNFKFWINYLHATVFIVGKVINFVDWSSKVFNSFSSEWNEARNFVAFICFGVIIALLHPTKFEVIISSVCDSVVSFW